MSHVFSHGFPISFPWFSHGFPENMIICEPFAARAAKWSRPWARPRHLQIGSSPENMWIWKEIMGVYDAEIHRNPDLGLGVWIILGMIWVLALAWHCPWGYRNGLFSKELCEVTTGSPTWSCSPGFERGWRSRVEIGVDIRRSLGKIEGEDGESPQISLNMVCLFCWFSFLA